MLKMIQRRRHLVQIWENKFYDRISNNKTLGKGRSNTIMKLTGGSPLQQFLGSKGKIFSFLNT